MEDDPTTGNSNLSGYDEVVLTKSTQVHNPAIVKGGLSLEKEVHVTTGCTSAQMHVMDWAEVQREDPMLSAVLDWLKASKKTDLKALLVEHASSEEGQMIL